MRIAPLHFILFLFSIYSWGQSIEPGYSLNTPQGIPVDEVYQVREDHEGRLFVATDQGVYVVNGAEIKNYSTEDGLADNTVFRFYIDNANRVWALSYHGGLCYFENDEWHIPSFNADYLKRPEKNFPYYFIQDQKTGRYHFDNYGIDNIFYSASLGDTVVKVDSITPPDGDGYSAFALYDKEGSYLLASRALHALRLITYRNLKFKLGLQKVSDTTQNGLPVNYYYFQFNDENSELDMIIQFNFSDTLHDGSRLMSTGLDLWRESADGEITHICRTPAPVNSMNVYGNEVFLNLFKGGTARYTYERGKLKFHETSFPNQTISDVFKSSNGRYWVSTIGEGLQKVFEFEVRNIPLPFNGSERIARPFFLEDSIMIILHENFYNKYRINRGQGTLHHLEEIELPRTIVSDYSYQYIVIDDRDLVSKAFHIRLDENYDIEDASVTADNVIYGGLRKFWPYGDSLYYYTYRDQLYRIGRNSRPELLTEGNSTYSLEEVIIQNNQLSFLTSLEGILLFDGQELSPAFPNHFEANTRITSYAHIDNDWVIASTKDEGALIFNKDTVYSISVDDMLPEQFINSIGADEQHVYVGFSNSIFIAKIHKGIVTSYRSFLNAELGIEGTINQFLPVHDGVYVESGSMMTFLPFSILKSSASNSGYNITPTSLSNEEEVTYKEGVPHYILKRGITGMTFQLNAKSPFENSLQTWYWRTDTSQDWRVSKDGEIQISNSRNGHFELLIKYRDENGIITDEHVALTYDVRPLLSETWWFWMIVLSPVLVLALTIIRNSLRQRRLSRELLSSNMSSLRMQINPHFIFNSFNSIQYLISMHKNETASTYLTRLAKLIRTTIERPELHRISLFEELEYVTEFLSIETMRLDDKMRFEIKVDEDINQNQVFIPPMLLQPILENAVWHGVSKKSEGGIVMISVEQKSDTLVIHIEDNGDGFPEDKWRKLIGGESLEGSLGLKNVITRLRLLSEMHHKEYKLDLLYGQSGTHFVLTLAL